MEIIFIYGVAAAFPFFTGMIDACLVCGLIQWWRTPYQRPSKLATAPAPLSASAVAIIVAIIIAVHLATWLIRREAVRKGGVMGLGATAWRVLFRGSCIAGVATGIWLFWGHV